MKRYLYIAVIAILLAAEVSGTPPANDEAKNQHNNLPELCPALKNELFGFIATYHEDPQTYIVNKFTDHDIVLLGEFYRIRQHVLFVQELIPKLYENGIYNLGVEYALHEDQPLIDSLLTSDTYVESLAYSLLFHRSPFWGYQEYADLFKVAWALNRDVHEGSKPFRIVGLNRNTEWSDTTDQVECDDPDEFMAEVIMDQFIKKDQQALIFSGLHHAFTEYKQPLVDSATGEFIGFVDDRMGNIIHEQIGKRAITVALHSPWINAKGYDHPYVYPADGMVDALLTSLPTFYRSVGFDIKGTPFGSLPAKKTLYRFGYDEFLFSDFCDGYICLCTISDYRGVSPIENFATDALLEEAKQRSRDPAFREDSITAKHFNISIRKHADIPYRLRDLE